MLSKDKRQEKAWRKRQLHLIKGGIRVDLKAKERKLQNHEHKSHEHFIHIYVCMYVCM